jgi:hypothetical protein
MLSDKAVKILADKIAPEVIAEIAMSDAFIEFLHEQIPTLIDEKLGECEPDLLFDLAMCVLDKVKLTTFA